MNDFSNRILQSNYFYSLGTVEPMLIEQAQVYLNLIFAEDYKDYLRTFGAATFNGHELTGISTSHRLNVVSATNRARKYFDHFPSSYYVVEELLFDHIIVVQDETGKVYSYSPIAESILLAESLKAYYFPDD